MRIRRYHIYAPSNTERRTGDGLFVWDDTHFHGVVPLAPLSDHYDVPSTRGSAVFYSKDFAWEKSRQEQEKLQNPTEEQRKKLAADAARKERLKRRRCEE